MKILLRLAAALAVVSVLVVYWGKFRREQLRLDLRNAVQRGDLTTVRDLIQKGATQPNSQNYMVMIGMAIEARHEEVALVLFGPALRFMVRSSSVLP